MKTSQYLIALTGALALMGVAMGGAEARHGDRDGRGHAPSQYDNHRGDHRGDRHDSRRYDHHDSRRHDRHDSRRYDRHDSRRYDRREARRDNRIYRRGFSDGRRTAHRVHKRDRYAYHRPVHRRHRDNFGFYVGNQGFYFGLGHNAYGRHYGRYYRYDCQPVQRIGYWRGYEALIGGTMCFDQAGYGYVLPNSRYLIQYVY